MPPAPFALGIDFGTSNTVAMLRWPDGRVKPLLFEGSPLLPSAVFAPADGGGLVVGADALHHARHSPQGLEPNPKRHIDEVSVLLGDREVTVVELVAAVLRRVADEAGRVSGGSPLQTAMSHPAGWGPVRRSVLVDAAAAAGLGPVLLVPEPTAAANYFTAVLDRDLAVGKALVVYDLGAGTFDASVVRRNANGFEVVAVDGLDDVGGLDVDAAIVAWLRDGYGLREPEVWARLSNPVAADDRRQRRLLWDDVRVAKEMLSRAPAVLLRLPLADIDAQLTREEFETAAQPLLARTIRTVSGLIRYAELSAADISGLLLVGGSSRIPLVATMLHRAVGIAPTATEQPELVVAEGTLQSVGHPGQSPAPPGLVQPVPPGSAPPAFGAPVPPAFGPPVPSAFGSPVSMPGSAAPVSGPPVPAVPVSGPPVSAAPVSGTSVTDTSVLGQPVSGPPASAVPVSAVPVSAMPVSPSGTVYRSGEAVTGVVGHPVSGPPPPNEESRVIPLWTIPAAGSPPAGDAQVAKARRPRTLITLMLSGLLVVLVVVGITAGIAWRFRPGQNQVGAQTSSTSSASAGVGNETGSPTSAESASTESSAAQNGGPTCNPCYTYVTVPNVSNQYKDYAASQLRNVGLTVGTYRYETNPCVSADNVIRTMPAAGQRVAQGSTVTLVLADSNPQGKTCVKPSGSSSASPKPSSS